mmetsp:Transcript_23886/g.36305  ORF Transcript_23886/g.36305 Transcript_23886/m.36305 type:complete len:212 (-) Transcript_23886:108-743(-)
MNETMLQDMDDKPSITGSSASVVSDEADSSETNQTKKVSSSQPTESNDEVQPVQDEKKMKRILANRRSARESYQRRKKLFSNLETTISDMRKENMKLVDENLQLRQQVTDLHRLVEQRIGMSLGPLIANNQMGNNVGPSGARGMNGLGLPELFLQNSQKKKFLQSMEEENQMTQQSLLHQEKQHPNQMHQYREVDNVLMDLIMKGNSSTTN